MNNQFYQHMKIINNREYAIASTDVRGINNKEMRQMHELNNRIKTVHITRIKGMTFNHVLLDVCIKRNAKQ